MGKKAKRGKSKRTAAPRVQRAYQSTQPSNYRPHSRSSGDANAVVGSGGFSLRQQARFADENNDNAHAVLDTLVTRIVGRGLIVEPQVRNLDGKLADDVNESIEGLLTTYARTPEVTGLYSLSAAERLACRTWLRDGECFSNHVLGVVDDLPGTDTIPYRFQLLEPDHCPADLPETRNPRVLQGITLNRWNAPVFYNITDEHPEAGDSLSYLKNTRPVPASQISHLAFRLRIGQLRGVSILAPVLDRLIDLNDLDTSERIAHKLAARLVGFIRKGSPDDYNDSGDDTDSDSDRLFDLVAGSIIDDLRPGEDIELLDTKRDATNFAEVRKAMLRSTTAATMGSYSSTARDYEGSYSSQRQELAESAENYRILLDEFVHHFRRPVHERLILAGISTGAIQLTDTVDAETLFDAVFYASQVPSIDSQKEANANKILLETKQASISELIRLRGRNPREVARQIASDKKLFPPDPMPQPVATEPEQTEDEGDEEDDDTQRKLSVVQYNAR